MSNVKRTRDPIDESRAEWARQVRESNRGTTSTDSSTVVAVGKKATESFQGLYAFVVTPLTHSGEVNYDAVSSYAESLASDGVQGVVVATNGIGEGLALASFERCDLFTAWSQAAKLHKLRVIANIGATSLTEMRSMAQYVVSNNIALDGFMVGFPVGVLGSLSAADIAETLIQVSGSTGSIPIVYRHHNRSASLYDVLDALTSRGSSPIAAAMTGGDLSDITRCVTAYGSKLPIGCCDESLLLPSVTLGVKFFAGPFANCVAPLQQRLIAAVTQNDPALKIYQGHLATFSSILGHRGKDANVGAVKVLAGLRSSMDFGAPRKPASSLAVKDVVQLKSTMQTFVESYTRSLPAKKEAPKIPDDFSLMPGFSGQKRDLILSRVNAMSKALDVSVESILQRLPHLKSPSTARLTPRSTSSIGNAGRYIDHTLLKPEGTKEEIKKLCQEAVENDFYAVCVNGSRVSQCVDLLKGTNVQVACVVGFPLGAMDIKSKAREARECVRLGVQEVDMVLNIGKLKDKDYIGVADDIAAVVEASRPAIVKVIFETCLLDEVEIIDCCILSVLSEAVFVKTSTGFNKGGATPEAVDIMLGTVGNSAQVKASGGVRDYAMAMKYLKVGVQRIGTSSGIAIVKGTPAGSGY